MQLSSTSFGSAAHEILMKPHTTIPIYHCISISTITENIKSTTASTSSTSNCIWACPTRLKTCKNNNFLSLSSYCTVVAAVLYRLSLWLQYYTGSACGCSIIQAQPVGKTLLILLNVSHAYTYSNSIESLCIWSQKVISATHTSCLSDWVQQSANIQNIAVRLSAWLVI